MKRATFEQSNQIITLYICGDFHSVLKYAENTILQEILIDSKKYYIFSHWKEITLINLKICGFRFHRSKKRRNNGS